MAENPTGFDPLGMLSTLDRHRVTYIVIGALARVIHGADEVTRGIDIVPSTREENLRRLEGALRDLGARQRGRRGAGLQELSLPDDSPLELDTERGELKIVVQPAGTRGYDDLRRKATREPLGSGLRPAVASVGDLARMLSALGREDDDRLRALRRLAELERQLSPEL